MHLVIYSCLGSNAFKREYHNPVFKDTCAMVLSSRDPPHECVFPQEVDIPIIF